MSTATPHRETGQEHREELLTLIAATTAQLTTAWKQLRTAQGTLLLRLERVRFTAGAIPKIRAHIADFNAAVAEFDRTARAIVERWAATDLPTAYRDGALRALRSAARPLTLFTWSTAHQAALTPLTATFYVDLIARIQETVRRAQAFARAALAAARTHTGVKSALLLVDHPLETVIYANRARHPVHSWARAALSWQAVVATNTGALNVSRYELGVTVMQVADGPECGWTSHPDTDHADGTLRSVDDCAAYPAAHHGCVAEGTEVQAIGGLERAYRLDRSGIMAVIRTRGGRRISITPNHPVLTGRGWIPAGEVQEGDQVVARPREPRVGAASGSDLNQMPALVEDVFAALGKVVPDVPVISASHYFHGDGETRDGKVDVVGADGELWRVVDSSHGQQLGESCLQVADASAVPLSGQGHTLALFQGVDSSPGSSVGGIGVRRVAVLGADGDAAFFESANDGVIRNAEFLREAQRRSSGQVELDDVIEVGYLESVRGHVYDLSTTGHCYFANGILVHNCIRQFFPRPDLSAGVIE